MTTTIQPYTTAERRTQLRDLAEVWDERGEAVRALLLGALLHPSLPVPCPKGTCGKCSACLWNEYRDARQVAADLESGALSWTDWDETLTCTDRQEHARESAAMWAISVEDELVNGPRVGAA